VRVLVPADGRRAKPPCSAGRAGCSTTRRGKDNLVFNEYFHGDNGAGLGASHQTGWTGLIADVIRRRHGAVGSVGDMIRGLTQWPRIMTALTPGISSCFAARCPPDSRLG
jgi:hypothetical protein